jgi:hypothetical protein
MDKHTSLFCATVSDTEKKFNNIFTAFHWNIFEIQNNQNAEASEKKEYEERKRQK